MVEATKAYVAGIFRDVARAGGAEPHLPPDACEQAARIVESLHGPTPAAGPDDAHGASSLRLALRNVRALAHRMRRRGDTENAAHLIRFCDDAGVRDEFLREEPAR